MLAAMLLNQPIGFAAGVVLIIVVDDRLADRRARNRALRRGVPSCRCYSTKAEPLNSRNPTRR